MFKYPTDPNAELMQFSFNGFDNTKNEHKVPHLNTLSSESGFTSKQQ
jgi:hypothetical protein